MNGLEQLLSYKEICLRLGMAILLGGLIGSERAHKNRPAGFRTHILVCIGAALIALIEDSIRLDILSTQTPTSITLNYGRFCAQVITGIGFIGAGTIMREKQKTSGLTTAASLWATGCLGLVIGLGLYRIGALGAISVYLTLNLLKWVERVLIQHHVIERVEVVYSIPITSISTLANTYHIFDEYGFYIKASQKNIDNNSIVFSLEVPKQNHVNDAASEMTSLHEVSSVNILRHK